MNNAFSLGKVTYVHPEGNTIDVLMYENGARIANVQVLGRHASSNSGDAGLTQPGQPSNGDQWIFEDSGDGDQIAVIGTIMGVPVCFGFLFPALSQMLFADNNRMLRRHASDWYETVDGAGNYEMYHPSGSFIRIGSTAAHEDLTGKDVNGKFAITKNTTSAPYLSIGLSNAGTSKATIQIDPSGNITVNGTTIAFTGNTTINGTLNVTGDITAPDIKVGANLSVLLHYHTSSDGATISPMVG